MSLHPIHAKIGTTCYRVVYCTESVYTKVVTGKLKIGDRFGFRYENHKLAKKIDGFVMQLGTENTILMISL